MCIRDSVDGVQETDAVAELLQHFSALDEDTALRIGDYKGCRVGLGSTLHQVGELLFLRAHPLAPLRAVSYTHLDVYKRQTRITGQR